MQPGRRQNDTTITLCSAYLFPDRFDSVIYVNKERVLRDVNIGFEWDFQKSIIDEVRQTGHFSETLARLYGEANAAQLVSLYTTTSDEEIKASWNGRLFNFYVGSPM